MTLPGAEALPGSARGAAAACCRIGPAGLVEWRAGGAEWRAAQVMMEEMTAAESGLDASLYIGWAELGLLPPDARIDYRLGELSGAFRTPRPEGEPVGFLVLGDSGSGSEEQALIGARMGDERDVAFVLHTGDLAYPIGAVSEIREHYLRAYASMMDHITFLPCPGNHEYMTGSLASVSAAAGGAGRGAELLHAALGPLDFLAGFERAADAGGRECNADWLAEELQNSAASGGSPSITAVYGRQAQDDPFVALVREHLAPMLETRRVAGVDGPQAPLSQAARCCGGAGGHRAAEPSM